MRFFKRYFSLFLPIFVLSLSFNIYSYTQKLLDEYKENVNKNYSIVIATKVEIQLNKIDKIIEGVRHIEKADTDKLISPFTKTLSSENIQILKNSMPYFYNILLDFFPSSEELREIEKNLYDNQDILKVETFFQKHSNFTQMVILINGVINFFIFMIIVLSSMLIGKQAEVWHFEHSRNMEIMSLFGASLWMKTSNLFKLAIISSIISSFMVVLLFYFIHNNDSIKREILELGLYLVDFNIFMTLIKSLFASLTTSFIIIMSVIIFHRNKS